MFTHSNDATTQNELAFELNDAEEDCVTNNLNNVDTSSSEDEQNLEALNNPQENDESQQAPDIGDTEDD